MNLILYTGICIRIYKIIIYTAHLTVFRICYLVVVCAWGCIFIYTNIDRPREYYIYITISLEKTKSVLDHFASASHGVYFPYPSNRTYELARTGGRCLFRVFEHRKRRDSTVDSI